MTGNEGVRRFFHNLIRTIACRSELSDDFLNVAWAAAHASEINVTAIHHPLTASEAGLLIRTMMQQHTRALDFLNALRSGNAHSLRAHACAALIPSPFYWLAGCLSPPDLRECARKLHQWWLVRNLQRATAMLFIADKLDEAHEALAHPSDCVGIVVERWFGPWNAAMTCWATLENSLMASLKKPIKSGRGRKRKDHSEIQGFILGRSFKCAEHKVRPLAMKIAAEYQLLNPKKAGKIGYSTIERLFKGMDITWIGDMAKLSLRSQ